MNGLEIDNGSVTSEAEDVFSDSEIARAPSLFAREMGEGVLDFHALA